MAMPTFVPTPQQRLEVEAMAGFGVPQPDIARIIGISDRTLRKAFRHELDVGAAKANAKIGQTLFQQAINGNVAAAIFWAKVRMGWRESRPPTPEGEGAPTVVIRGGFTDD